MALADAHLNATVVTVRQLGTKILLKTLGYLQSGSLLYPSLDTVRAANSLVGNITQEEYLAWTFDEVNGLFALLDKRYEFCEHIIIY
jgi:hypothetical protein